MKAATLTQATRIAQAGARKMTAMLGAVKVDAAAYRAAALDAQRTTGELLPGCVLVPASEHFGVSFGKDSGPGTDAAGKEEAPGS